MPPKKPASTAPPPSSSRKSSRIAEDAAPEASAEETKPGSTNKRPADSKPKSGPASKKAKPTSAKPTLAPKSKPDETSATAAAEKEAEAPKSAKPDTGGKGAMKLGDKLPKMTLMDNEGEEVEVGGLAGEKGLVVFLYPKAATPGCTTQACGFRDAFTDIAALGYKVYGLSKDKPDAQQKWITKHELNYKLLCDPESKLIKRLGAFVNPNNTKRSHFIFEKGSGKLVDLQVGVKPADDPANCLKFIKQHHK